VTVHNPISCTMGEAKLVNFGLHLRSGTTDLATS